MEERYAFKKGDTVLLIIEEGKYFFQRKYSAHSGELLGKEVRLSRKMLDKKIKTIKEDGFSSIEEPSRGVKRLTKNILDSTQDLVDFFKNLKI